MPPKKRSDKKQLSSTKARTSPAPRPSTSHRFDEIEHLLESLQGGASSSTKRKGAAASSTAPRTNRKKQPAESEDAIEEFEERIEDFQLQSQLTAGESSLSDDIDTNAFLEQFKTLAAQKKKVSGVSIASVRRANIHMCV